MNIEKSPNLNILWSSLIIEELVRNGIDHFCVAPGSRSAPLAVAVSENPNAKSIVHFDERGCGFYALGYASATKKACCVITTSGTAAANLFPAIIEASKKKVPLIILTADRPAELRFTGANQTIDQVKMYGEYVRWFFDMPTPTLDISPQFVLTTIDQAIHKTKGELKGPIHINCMFREPLSPIKAKINLKNYARSIDGWLKNKSAYTRYTSTQTTFTENEITAITEIINKTKLGLITVGKIASEKEAQAVIKLSEKLNWPIFPDITSGLRLGNSHKNVIHYFDQLLSNPKLANQFKVETVLHLGGRMTSKRYYDFISTTAPKEYITVLNHPLRNDPLHNVTIRIQSGVGAFCEKIFSGIKPKKASAILSTWQKMNKNIDRLIDSVLYKDPALTEPQTARLISENIPKNHGLFISNSLPIREMDMFATHKGFNVPLSANRGASGIDGIVASAVGFSQGLNKPVTLAIGDLALLYDLNSLSLLKELKNPMTLIIFNNNGGGIFSFLPISEFTNFEKFFGTPHNLDFDCAAKMFGLNYLNPKSTDEFVNQYQTSVRGNNSSIIEIKTSRQINNDFHLQIRKYITRRS